MSAVFVTEGKFFTDTLTLELAVIDAEVGIILVMIGLGAAIYVKFVSKCRATFCSRRYTFKFTVRVLSRSCSEGF